MRAAIIRASLRAILRAPTVEPETCLPRLLMEKLQVRRVGVLVKPNQPEALQTICRLVEWCSGRGIKVAGGPRLRRDEIEAETGCSVESLTHDELGKTADLFVVLRRDGAMIGAGR